MYLLLHLLLLCLQGLIITLKLFLEISMGYFVK